LDHLNQLVDPLLHLVVLLTKEGNLQPKPQVLVSQLRKI
jgi:hypothetical protein